MGKEVQGPSTWLIFKQSQLFHAAPPPPSPVQYQRNQRTNQSKMTKRLSSSVAFMSKWVNQKETFSETAVQKSKEKAILGKTKVIHTRASKMLWLDVEARLRSSLSSWKQVCLIGEKNYEQFICKTNCLSSKSDAGYNSASVLTRAARRRRRRGSNCPQKWVNAIFLGIAIVKMPEG